MFEILGTLWYFFFTGYFSDVSYFMEKYFQQMFFLHQYKFVNCLYKYSQILIASTQGVKKLFMSGDFLQFLSLIIALVSVI